MRWYDKTCSPQPESWHTSVAGWHSTTASTRSQRYFVLAVKLAARAGDYPLSGHILRAMAHQAIDLGACKQGLDLAAASVEGQRYQDGRQCAGLQAGGGGGRTPASFIASQSA